MYDIYRKKSNPLIPKGILQKRLSESGFSEKEGGGGAIRQTEKNPFGKKCPGGLYIFLKLKYMYRQLSNSPLLAKPPGINDLEFFLD